MFQTFAIASKHRSATTQVVCLPPARSGDVGTSLDIGHLGGGLLVLHIHDRVERFVGPVGPRMCSWGLGDATERLVTPARLLGQVLPRTAK